MEEKRKIVRLCFRSIDKGDLDFKEIEITDDEHIFKINNKRTDAGMLFYYTLRVYLNQKAFYSYEGLQFDVYFSDGTHILIGNENYPAFMNTAENLGMAQISVDWKDTDFPRYLQV